MTLRCSKNRPSATQFFCCGGSFLTLGFLAAMIGLFVWQSIPVFKHEGLGYFTGNIWSFRTEVFGALSMIYGTVIVSGISLAVAVPVGIGAAIFTSEFLHHRLRIVVKSVMELLAGIPSVVYGLLGILFLRNWVYDGFESFEILSGDTLLTAGLLLGVMILPTVMTLTDDTLRSVVNSQRLAARGLGLNSTESILFVVIPQAVPGIIAAILLSLGRALGEAIAVFLVIGRQDNQAIENWFSLQSFIQAGQTLTSKLAGSETNIAFGDSLHWGAMMGLGLILMTGTAALVLTGTWLQRKYNVHA